MPLRRLGDNGRLVLLQLVGKDEGGKKKHKVTSAKGDSGKKSKKPKKAKKPVSAEGVSKDAEATEAVDSQ